MNMQALTPEDILRVSLKRKWWIIASVVVCVALGYVAEKYFPKVFKSTVIVTIDSPRIAKDYVKGLGQEAKFNEDPTTLVMQQVLLALTNRSILMPIIETLKPYPNAESASPDQLMRQLRKAVTVGKPKDSVGVAVSYFNADPFMAQAVTALLAVKLQEDNINRRESLIATTTDFLSAELERMKRDLEVKEREISEFKRAHLGELPQQMEANLRTLDRLQVDLTNSTDSLNKMEERLTALEKSIREFSEFAPIGIVPFDQERRVGSAMPVDPRVARVRELKHKLSELLGAYKENYPDVVNVKEEIRRLESATEVDASQLSVSEPGEAKADVDGNVVRKPTDPYLRELMKERSEVKSEIALLRDKLAHTTRQIKELEARVEQTPASEQGLAVLLRDYENMQKSYQALLDKRTNAKILQNYEDRQLGEQYRIIEPANLPNGPEPPTQLHFLLGGLAVGCLIGFGSAIGVELLKTGFRRPEEVESHLGLPVLASIPPFSSATSEIGTMQSRALLVGPG
ncbi:MAG: hypothetical protein OEV08_09155, partial [Nitrospira sp.]|nr:hypothetical protein [Nitrospira sp.]